MKVRHAALAFVALGAGIRVVTSLLADDDDNANTNDNEAQRQQIDAPQSTISEQGCIVQVENDDDEDEAFEVVHAENRSVEHMLNARAPVQRMRDIEWPSNTECSVCLETMCRNTRVRVTPCNHVLHSWCLEKWVYYTVEKNYRRPLCPNCLSDLGINVPSPPPLPPPESNVVRIVINEEFGNIPHQLIAEDAYVRLMVQRALETRRAARSRLRAARVSVRAARVLRTQPPTPPFAPSPPQQQQHEQLQSDESVVPNMDQMDNVSNQSEGAGSSSSLVVETGVERK